ncbi:serine hydrolase domain-containing protein [Streptomyces sp. 21So2-11]|uniref:serine hydrolase domain-containing protein n=1 Tax=Streptomyces sp. 21So2-11 TaxID=3144408 RepID=UPI0032197C13
MRPFTTLVRIRVLAVTVLLTICVGTGVHMAPAPARLGGATTGDRNLAAQVRDAAGDGRGFRGLSVAVVDHGTLRFAGLGDSGNRAHSEIDASTVFEAGSIGKPMTGMLLAALEDKKILDLSTPLKQMLPDSGFSDPAVADATLEDLATHRAGLEKMPPGLRMTGRNMRLLLLGQDPYRGLNDRDVLNAAEASSAGSPGTYRYSNLGMALAGYTAAHRTGLPYTELLATNIFEPLTMRDTRIMHSGDPFPSNVAHGQQATGPSTEHWYASGYTPAGDIWTTGQDLGRFLRAVIQKTAPGARAAVPAHAAGPGGRTGLGWLTSTVGKRDITWQNGATGGFTSYLGFDRTTGQGVVVLSNTDRSVDAIGQRLLGLPTAPSPTDITPAVGTMMGSLGAPAPLLAVRLRRSTPAPRRRALLCLHAFFGAITLWLTWRLGDWLTLPPALWALGAGVLMYGLLSGVTRTDIRSTTEQSVQTSAVIRVASRATAVWAASLAALLTTQL